jgi:hypothetical protein
MTDRDISVFTHEDDAAHQWHDNIVHARAWEPWSSGEVTDESAVLLGFDYIAEWVKSDTSGGKFSFWVSPSTLIFDGAWDFHCKTQVVRGAHRQIDTIQATPIDVPSGKSGFSHWTVNGHNFAMSFKGRGFRQFLRARPVFTETPGLSLGQRGGISFELRGFSGSTE